MSNEERVNDKTVRTTEQETNDEAEVEQLVDVSVFSRRKATYVEATFITQKRLTYSDLDEDKGCLSIPEDDFKNALQFLSRTKKEEIESGRSVPVTLFELNGVDQQKVNTNMLLRKSATSYEFAGAWNEIKRANEEKFRGVDGLHAVIQLHCYLLGEEMQFMLVKEPEIPERLNKFVESMQGASKPKFLTQKRLSESDLDQSEGCLLIPDALIDKAILFRTIEMAMLDHLLPWPVRLIDINDDELFETIALLIRKSIKDYALTKTWNEVLRRNEKKLTGFNGAHAVIRIWFFRNRSLDLYFGLYIAEAAYREDAAEASTSHGSGLSNTTQTLGMQKLSTNPGSGSNMKEILVPETMKEKSNEETNVDAEVKRLADGSVYLRGKDTFVKATFITQKRLTDSDLDEDKGCLSIPEEDFKNALPFLSRTKKERIESGRSWPVTFLEFNGVEAEEANNNMLLRKSAMSYEFAGAWNYIKRANEEKFRGVDGLHAVIQLHCFLVVEAILFILVKEPEIPERLNKYLETIQNASRALFLTQKRLSDSDLDQGEDCLLIPDASIDKANPFRTIEMTMLDQGSPWPVRLIDINDDELFETIAMLIRKPNKDFALTKAWNEVTRRNEKKLMGVDGPPAFIQLWFFHKRRELYFALRIAKKAYRGDAAEASTSHGSGPSNTKD